MNGYYEEISSLLNENDYEYMELKMIQMSLLREIIDKRLSDF